MEIADREQLEAWLKGRSREVAVVIGTRAALRVVPMIADYVREHPERRTSEFVSPIFRALAAPSLVGMWPSRSAEIRAAIAVARAAVAGRATPARSVAAAQASAAARAAAAAGATAAARAATADASIVAARDAAVRAANASASAANSSTVWGEITADAEAFEAGLSPDTLMRRPLWSLDTPKSIQANWARLKTALLARSEAWKVWTEWYEDRLCGEGHSDSRPLIEVLELKRVLIPNEDWDMGATHVNSLLAALETEYRANPPPKSEPLPAPPDIAALDGIDPDEIEAPEVQAPFATRFSGDGDNPIGVDYRISQSALADNAAARDRHEETVRCCEQILGAFDPSERGANTVTELIEDVRLYRDSLGAAPKLANPDFLVPRGDALRDRRDRYEKADEFSDLPPISDKYKIGLSKIVKAHNNYVGLDPELASRDEGLLGPDARKNIVSPLEGRAVIHDAVERRAARQEVEDVLEEVASVAPLEADPENRRSRRYSESVKNFARFALGKAHALAKYSWNHKGKITSATGGLVGAAKWALVNEAWLLKTFSSNPAMIETIAEILKILKFLPLV